jgi:hypothetical protein
MEREGRVKCIRRGVEEERESAECARARRRAIGEGAAKSSERRLVHVELSMCLNSSSRGVIEDEAHLALAEVTCARHAAGFATP